MTNESKQTPNKRMKRSSIIKWKINLLEALGIILFIVFFLPIVLVILNAAKESSFLVTSDPLSLPVDIGYLFSNISEVWNNPNINFQSAFISSLIVTTLSLAAIVIVSSMAGWALVRRKTKASNIIFYLFVAAMIIPFQVVMLPLVSWFRALRDWTGIPF